MVLLDLQIYPNDKGVNLSEYVARCMAVIDQSGVTYKLHPMGTILEGEWEAVNAVVTNCFKALEKDCDRIAINIRVDYRAGDKSRLKSKIESVEKVVGKKTGNLTFRFDCEGAITHNSALSFQFI